MKADRVGDIPTLEEMKYLTLPTKAYFASFRLA